MSTTIRKLREDLDMPQSELAQKAGISTPTVSKMENGEPVSRDSFEKVCQALDVKPEDVVGVVLARRLRSRHNS